MVDISIRYNKSADREKSISYALDYPDGIRRILTMRQYQWDWIEVAERHRYPFAELLGAAIELSQEFPSKVGYQADILENTKYLLMITMKLIHEDQHHVANR